MPFINDHQDGVNCTGILVSGIKVEAPLRRRKLIADPHRKWRRAITLHIFTFDQLNSMYKYLGIAVCTAMYFLSWAQPELPPNFIDELLPSRFSKPVGIVFDHLGHGYVWEKDGLVWKVTEDGQKSAEPLIDIREEVTSWG